MDLLVPNLKDKLSAFQDHFKDPRLGEALRKLKKCEAFVHEYPIVGIVLGPIILTALLLFILTTAVILGPFIFILGSATAFTAGMLVLSLPFLLGAVAPMVISAGALIALLYITQCVTAAAIRCSRRLIEHIVSLNSSDREMGIGRIYKMFARLCNFLPSCNMAQSSEIELKMVSTCARESRSSDELEEIEPDYRDREVKLYDALVRKEYKEGDTFEPFPY